MDEEGRAEGRARELITAAHALFNSDRRASSQEVIITTLLEILTDGPLVTEQLCAEFKEIWPRVNVSTDDIEASLERAEEIGLVKRTVDPLGKG